MTYYVFYENLNPLYNDTFIDAPAIHSAYDTKEEAEKVAKSLQDHQHAAWVSEFDISSKMLSTQQGE